MLTCSSLNLIVSNEFTLPLTTGGTFPIPAGNYTAVRNHGQQPGAYSLIDSSGESIANVYLHFDETNQNIVIAE